MKKHCLTKILLAIYENNCNRNSQKFSYKFAFLYFRRNHKQESNIQLVGCLVTKNVSDFCLKGAPLSALLQRYTELNRLFREIFKEFLFACYSCSYYSFMPEATQIRKRQNRDCDDVQYSVVLFVGNIFRCFDTFCNICCSMKIYTASIFTMLKSFYSLLPEDFINHLFNQKGIGKGRGRINQNFDKVHLAILFIDCY